MVFDHFPRAGLASTAAVALTTVTLGLGTGMSPSGAAEVQPAKGPVPGTITTIGGGVGGPGLGTTVGIGSPCALTYSGGVLYAGDQGGVLASGAVRAISQRTGQLTTPVGSGIEGFTRDGGRAASAIGWACGLAVDRWHNLVFSDGDVFTASFDSSVGNDRVRVRAARTGTFYGQRMRAGHLYTLAGTGQAGHTGDGGKARNARLDDPAGVAIDQRGNVIVADDLNNRVRVIAEASGTFYGVQMHRGDIYTVAGTGTFGTTGLGGPAAQAELELRFGEPHGAQTSPSSAVRVDHQGNLVIADTSAGLVLVLAAHGGAFYGQRMKAGRLYSIAGGGAGGAGGLATSAALGAPDGLAIDHNDNVLISDVDPGPVQVVAVRTGRFYGKQMTAGHIYSLAVDSSQCVSVDGAGNVIGAGTGVITALVVRSGTFYGQRMQAGHLYRIAGVTQARLSAPTGVATRTSVASRILDSTVDHDGNLVLASLDSIFILAGHTGAGYGRHLVRGHFYTIASCSIDSVVASGGNRLCALGRSQSLFPSGITVDSHGNVLFGANIFNGLWVAAMHAGRFYGRAMKAGKIYRVAGGGGSEANAIPASQADVEAISVAIDQSGNLIESDGNLVRVITPRSGRFFGQQRKAGDIYTIGGGGTGAGDGISGTAAQLEPGEVRVDKAGNVVVTDQKLNLVRVIAGRTGTSYHRHMVAGDVYTIGGGGTSTASGVPARTASLHLAGLGLDAKGNVIVSDSTLKASQCCADSRSVVRVIASTTGQFYGQHMIGGRIYTIAGRGPVGFSGDGGRGREALLDRAGSVTYWPGHGAVIVDGIRIRQVTG